MIIQFISCYGHKRQTPSIDILAAGRICSKCVPFFNYLSIYLSIYLFKYILFIYNLYIYIYIMYILYIDIDTDIYRLRF